MGVSVMQIRGFGFCLRHGLLLQLRVLVQFSRYAGRNAARGFTHRGFNGVAKRRLIRAAMTFDHDAIESHHAGTVISPRVQAVLERSQSWRSSGSHELARGTTGEFLPHS